MNFCSKWITAIGVLAFAAIALSLGFRPEPAPSTSTLLTPMTSPTPTPLPSPSASPSTSSPASPVLTPPSPSSTPIPEPSDNPVTAFNRNRDFWATNYGKGGVAFFWANEPSGTVRVLVYRLNSKTGRWDIAEDAPVGQDLPRDLIDPIDGTRSDLVYRMDALSSGGKVLKRYQPVHVPKYNVEP